MISFQRELFVRRMRSTRSIGRFSRSCLEYSSLVNKLSVKARKAMRAHLLRAVSEILFNSLAQLQSFFEDLALISHC